MARGGNIEVAQAYVTIIPSLKGSQETIAKELGAEKIGEDSGKKLGSGISKGLGKAAKVVAKTFVAASATAVAGIGAITVSATKAYAEYEQLAGGAKQIFDGIDWDDISKDAQQAYKTMGMSANDYLESINQVGATFKATMGDKKGYETAKRGMKAISDYASGTGRSIEELNEKYQLITRSASGYQSIADQFSGILPQTSQDFLEQAQAAGFLSTEYEKLTEVPVAEYQEAVTQMLEKGVDALNLTGNTAREAEHTISGSLTTLRASWENFLTELGKDDADVEARVDELVDAAIAAGENVIPRAAQVVSTLFSKVTQEIASHKDEVVGAFTDIIDEITDGKFSEMADKVKPYLDRLSKSAQDLAKDLEPLSDDINAIGDALGGSFLTALQAVTDAFETLEPILGPIANVQFSMLAKEAQNVSAGLEMVVTAAEQVAQFLQDAFGPAVEWAQDKLGELSDFVGSSWVGKMLGGFDKTAQGAEKGAKRVQDSGKGYEKLGTTASDATSRAASNVNANMSKAATSVKQQSDNAAKNAESGGKRMEQAWNKSYTTKLNAKADTSGANSTMQTFLDRWRNRTVTIRAVVSSVAKSLGLETGGVIVSKMAAGGIAYDKHADGFIANRRGPGVDITRHIVGESGAEAVIPLTNRRYVAPFAETVADYVNADIGGVTVTGNTFVVRKESDIPAIGRAINQQAERERRARL